MKKYLLLIPSLLTILASCTDSGYISKEEMAGILYNFILTDKCLDEAGALRLQADTTLVYKPILDKAGYTSEQFIASLKHWLSNPEDMKKIYALTGLMLKERRNILQAEISAEEKREREEIRIRDSLERIESRPAKMEREHIRQEKLARKSAVAPDRKKAPGKLGLKKKI